jgi:hypothetical protein
MPAVPIKIYNRVGRYTYPLTGYALPYEIFKYEADFTNIPVWYSDKKVIWNFGDGTLSNDLTGFHYYKYPGLYPVTLTVFESSGDSSVSSIVSSVNIYNAVNDIILLTTQETLTVISGRYSSSIFLTRYNSWQTSITGKNVLIKLAVSGNRSEFFNEKEYYSNPYSQLYPSSKFIVEGEEGATVTDILTTTNVMLYASPLSTMDTSISAVSSADSVYAGTYGTATFYYTEDYNN